MLRFNSLFVFGGGGGCTGMYRGATRLNSRFSHQLFVFGVSLLASAFGWFLAGSWQVLGRFLAGSWQILGRLLAGSWQVLGRFLAGSRQVLGIALRVGLKVYG